MRQDANPWPRLNRWNLLLIVLLGASLFLTSCSDSKPRKRFLYPDDDKLERERICLSARKVRQGRFSVSNGKVYIPNILVGPSEDVRTYLPDGDYYCGRAETYNIPCSPGTTRFLTGRRCSFQR